MNLPATGEVHNDNRFLEIGFARKIKIGYPHGGHTITTHGVPPSGNRDGLIRDFLNIRKNIQHIIREAQVLDTLADPAVLN